MAKKIHVMTRCGRTVYRLWDDALYGYVTPELAREQLDDELLAEAVQEMLERTSGEGLRKRVANAMRLNPDAGWHHGDDVEPTAQAPLSTQKMLLGELCRAVKLLRDAYARFRAEGHSTRTQTDMPATRL